MGRARLTILRRRSPLFHLIFIALIFLTSSSLLGKAGAQQDEAVFAVNCGGPESIDKSGAVYRADSHFLGGQTYKTKAGIAGTEDDVVYQTERWGKFSYTIPLAKGNYTLTLRFAEIYEYATWIGARVFSVKVEGKLVLSSLDVFRKAGGQYKAYDVAMPVKITDGVLNIEFYNQRENAKVNAILVTKQGPTPPTTGTIKGKVTDSSTGLPIPQATVSVSDSSTTPRSTQTDQNGLYEIPGIAVGGFTGEIKKNGYNPFPLQGTMPTGQTLPIDGSLSPILPVISELAVKDVTMDSARIVWKTDQLADSLVDYGETEAYGGQESNSDLTKSRELLLRNLKPETLYHYRVISRNEYGFSSSSGDRTFTTQGLSSPIMLEISYPAEGSTISSSSVRVEGFVRNHLGNETGVMVNGVLANIYGEQFVANHVPLTEGSNTIIAKATDVKGNEKAEPVGVSAVVPMDYLKITANVDSGVIPLDVFLTLDSNLDLADAELTYDGPGEIELLKTSGDTFKVKIKAEGRYIFTARLVDLAGNILEDTTAIVVLSRAELDTLLQGKWEGMKTKLSGGDIEGALEHFDESAKLKYREIFSALAAYLPDITKQMSDTQFIDYKKETAIYDIRTVRDGVEYSFQLLFRKDENGIWKIYSF